MLSFLLLAIETSLIMPAILIFIFFKSLLDEILEVLELYDRIVEENFTKEKRPELTRKEKMKKIVRDINLQNVKLPLKMGPIKFV